MARNQYESPYRTRRACPPTAPPASPSGAETDDEQGAPIPLQRNTAMTSEAAKDVIAERQRQVSVEGWTPEHDDEHVNSEMAKAATHEELREAMAWAIFDERLWPGAWIKASEAERDSARQMAQAALSVMTARLAQARIEALEEAALACERQERAFFSPEYATGQPLSSFKERFAVSQCAKAIRALKDG